MNFFGNLSIKGKFKLVLIGLSLGIAAIVLLGTLASNTYNFKRNLQRDVKTLAQFAADDISSAMLLTDHVAAAATLQTISRKPAFQAAAITDDKGRLFQDYPVATYAKQNRHLNQDEWSWQASRFTVSVPVISSGEQLGTLHLTFDLSQFYDSLRYDLFFTVALFLLSISLSTFASAKLESLITRPITKLVATSNQVSTSGDFSLRAEKVYEDDIGALVDSFNQMLATIEGKNSDLEKKVAERTRELVIQAEDLERARDEAQSAAKARSDFLANMSHEIRTPMNGVIGMTDLLLDTELNTDQEDLASTVKLSANALLTIINDILDFSKIEAGKLELAPITFSLSAELDNISKLMQHRIEQKKIELLINIDDHIPDALYGDPDRLRQIILNMLSNSLKFTPEQGGIVLMVNLSEQLREEVAIEFSVIDSGIGVAKDKQSKIFNAFEQADNSTTRKYGGTGLGLAISSQLVSLMGGSMEMWSNPGTGTVFQFVVKFGLSSPDAKQQVFPADRGQQSASQSAALSQNLKVLLVEDNLVNQKLAAKILEKHGIQAVTALNGAEAVECYEQGQFDLILMDIQMPVMGGIEATQAIRTREKGSGKHTPIIALTANAMKGDREKYLEAGMDDYVAKPIKRSELIEVMAQQVSRQHKA